jgi:GNAT superfamily N-acetyltransferase
VGAVALGEKTHLGWLADGTWVLTEPGGPSQRQNWRVGGDLDRAVTDRLRAVIRCEGGDALYDEPAIAAYEGGENILSGEDHEDRSLLLGAGLDWSSATLVHLAYGYRAIDSNSLGYSQDRHEVSVSIARLLPERISLQVVGLWQEPRYRDQGYAKWLLRDDPEDLDIGARTGVTLRLRRPLGVGFSADAQTGWERNEARVSGQFYERIHVLLAIRYQVAD